VAERTTVVSQEGYRYRLTRSDADVSDKLAIHQPTLLWIMLNPSTADDQLDDPTIRRVIGFTRRLGYMHLTVVNLYAKRATKPADLWRADDPVGPDNDQVIAEEAWAAAVDGVPILAAWGANARPDRVAQVLSIPHLAPRLHCLGTTLAGAPRHPLYLPWSAPLVRWEASR